MGGMLSMQGNPGLDWIGIGLQGSVTLILKCSYPDKEKKQYVFHLVSDGITSIPGNSELELSSVNPWVETEPNAKNICSTNVASIMLKKIHTFREMDNTQY